ncbi:MAG: sigma-54-dependent Fis family transcriptional regulator, partial [Candidatus Riflebacteria bacterium]|nr:sigma-54-dependent Fis family transcriptional regulator [Candidatus Riflebacteria bacterium]
LLRALESREVKPLGTDRAIPVDVRVVSATNRDLEEMVKKGTFREDLFYRLSVIRLKLPPLRERREDIPPLVAHFLRSFLSDCRFSAAALDSLARHPLPGNVRALRNLVERVAILCRGRTVEPSDLDLPPASDPRTGPPASQGTLEDTERLTIIEALRRHDGNQVRTAKALKIGLSTLRRKLKAYKDAGYELP